MTVWLLLAAAAAVLLWPSKLPEQVPFLSQTQPTERGHSYIEAVGALQLVRQRLIDTQQLSDEQQAAINSLTLALVAGSEK
jgi:hypothetical protein